MIDEILCYNCNAIFQGIVTKVGDSIVCPCCDCVGYSFYCNIDLTIIIEWAIDCG